MAQEMRILTWCDNTKRHGEADVPGRALPPLAVGKDKPRDLDLCDECRVELYEPLKALLDTEGRATDTGRRKNRKKAAEATTSTAEPYRCDDCGKTFAKPHGLATHVNIKHKDGPAEPTLLDDTQPHPCPDCDRSFAKPQGLNLHRVRAHGYRAEGAE